MADDVPETNPFVLLPRQWCAGKFSLEDLEAHLREVSPGIFVDPATARASLEALYEPMDLGQLEVLLPQPDTTIILEMPDEEPVGVNDAKVQEIIKKTEWLSEKDDPNYNYWNPAIY
jgi:hypothetical protein